MKCSKCRLRGLEISHRHVKDDTTPLYKLDGTAIWIGFVAIIQRPP